MKQHNKQYKVLKLYDVRFDDMAHGNKTGFHQVDKTVEHPIVPDDHK